MMSLMYHGCLRIGEAAVSKVDTHTLRLDNISFQCSAAGLPKSVLVVFRSYKHSKGEEAEISIKAVPGKQYCPVSTLWKYLSVRPCSTHTYLFLKQDGAPVTRDDYSSLLKVALIGTQYRDLYINTHSFRVGRTTDLVTTGNHSEEYIRKLGRWSSDAFRKYIRPLVLSC